MFLLWADNHAPAASNFKNDCVHHMPERTPDSKTLQNLSPSQCENKICRLKQSGSKNSRLFSSPTQRGHFGLCRTSLNSSSQSRPSWMKKKRNNPKTLALVGERENWMFLCAAQTRGLDWPYQLLGFKEHRQSGLGRQSTHRIHHSLRSIQRQLQCYLQTEQIKGNPPLCRLL